MDENNSNNGDEIKTSSPDNLPKNTPNVEVTAGNNSTDNIQKW